MKTTTNKIFGFELGFSVDERLTRWVGILFFEAAAIILVTWLLLIPRFGEIQKLNSDLATERVLQANLRSKLALIEDFGVEFVGQDQLINNTFLEAKDPGLVLAAVRQISNLAGMTISNYRISPTVLTNVATGKVAPTSEALEIELTVDGPAAAVGRFLTAMNESLPIKRVHDLEVGGGLLQATGQTLQLRMKVATYAFPAKVTANALELIKPFSDANRDLLQEMANYQRPPAVSGVGVITGNQNYFGL